MSPYTRKEGGSPDVRCRSEPWSSISFENNASILAIGECGGVREQRGSPVRQRGRRAVGARSLAFFPSPPSARLLRARIAQRDDPRAEKRSGAHEDRAPLPIPRA